MRPIDQDMVVTEDTLFLTVPKKRGHMGKHQGWAGGRDSKGETRASEFIVVSKERSDQGVINCLRLTSFE